MKRALITTLACTLAPSMTMAKTCVTEATQCVFAEQISGTIMNVDVETKSFTVVVEEMEIVLSFNADTKFLRDGKEVEAARLLKLGTKVTITRDGGLAKRVASIKDPQ